jgi:hypothetical protein
MCRAEAAFLMTECSQDWFSFAADFSRRVGAGFSAVQVSSDGGGAVVARGGPQDQPAGARGFLFPRRAHAPSGQASTIGDAGAAHLRAGAAYGLALRLYFSALAYTLVEAMRRLALKGTEWAEARVDAIRPKLFKIGAIVRISVRRVLLQLSSDYPWKPLFAHAYHALRC